MEAIVIRTVHDKNEIPIGVLRKFQNGYKKLEKIENIRWICSKKIVFKFASISLIRGINLIQHSFAKLHYSG